MTVGDWRTYLQGRRARPWLAMWATSLLALLTYGGAITIQHANPTLGRRIPFSGIIGNVEPHFAVAGTLSLLAVAAWTTTRGESRLAYRLRRND